MSLDNFDECAYAYDRHSLPANFYVWVSTKAVAFMHGRYAWANRDVKDLMAIEETTKNELGFRRAGIESVPSQIFRELQEGVNRSV